MIEKPARSVMKAVSWRITGTMDTIIVSYLITGKFTVAISIGGVEVFTKIILYFFHERIWDRIRYGRKVPREMEYNI